MLTEDCYRKKSEPTMTSSCGGIERHVLIGWLLVACVCAAPMPGCETFKQIQLEDGQSEHLQIPETACVRYLPTSPTEDQLIQITVQKLRVRNTSEHSGCQYHLHVYEGSSYDEKDRIVDLCQRQDLQEASFPVSAFSVQPYVVLRSSWLSADSSATIRLMPALEAASGCRQFTLGTGESREIMSNNYPQSYDTNSFECWIFTTTTRESIFEINIVDFHVDSSTGECNDRLDVFKWNTRDVSQNSLLHRMCSNQTGGSYIYLTQNSILLRFISNHDDTNTGFKIIVSHPSLKGSFSLSTAQTDCQPVPMSLTGQATDISSPDFPANYPSDIDMCWTVQPPSTVDMDLFEIAVYRKSLQFDPPWIVTCPKYDQSSSSYDRLDFISESGDVMESQCGSYPSTVERIVNSNKPFHIRFRSNSFLEASGFSMALQLISKSCVHFDLQPTNMYMYLDSEQQTGRSFDGTYEACWGVSTLIKGFMHNRSPENHVILINIESIDFSDQKDCSLQYLNVYDGDAPLNRILKLCPGDTIPRKLFTKSPSVWIRLRLLPDASYRIGVKPLHVGVTESLLKQERSASMNWTRCSNSWVRKQQRRSFYMTVYNTGEKSDTNRFQDSCERMYVLEPTPNTQLQMMVNYKETTFRLQDEFTNRFVSLYDGDSSDDSVLVNLAKNYYDGVITFSGPSSLAIAVSPEEGRFYGNLTSVEGGKFGNDCISIPINDTSKKHFIFSPNYPFGYPGNLDICWKAYLLSPDKDKRIVFRSEPRSHFYREDCQKYPTKTSDKAILYNDNDKMLLEGGFCDQVYFNFYMSRSKRCPDHKFLKLRFSSDSELAATGFYGYFYVMSKAEACEDEYYPPDRRLYYLAAAIAVVVLVIIIVCVVKQYRNKHQAAPQGTTTTNGTVPVAAAVLDSSNGETIPLTPGDAPVHV